MIVLLLVIGLLYANRSVGTVAGSGDLMIIHSYEGYNEAGEIKVFTQQYTVPANHPAYAQLSALVTGVKLRASIPTEFSNLAGQASITGENYRFFLRPGGSRPGISGLRRGHRCGFRKGLLCCR